MKAKALEIRDEGTFIAILAVDMNPSTPRWTDEIIDATAAKYSGDAQRYLLRRCGYPCDGAPNIMLTYLGGGRRADNDPYGWKDGTRTIPVAHEWIIKHWSGLRDGDVVDVQFILGETATKKTSERFGS